MKRRKPDVLSRLLVASVILATGISSQAITMFSDNFNDLNQWAYDGNATISNSMLVLEPAASDPWHASVTSIPTFSNAGRYELSFDTDANGDPAFQERVMMPGGLEIGFASWGNLAQVRFKNVLQSGTVAGSGVSAYGTIRTIKMVLDGRNAEIYVNGVLGWSATLDSDPDFGTYNKITMVGQFSVITNKYDNIELNFIPESITMFSDGFYDTSQWNYDGNATISNGMLVLEPEASDPWHASASSIQTFSNAGRYELLFDTDANGDPAFHEQVIMPGGLEIGFSSWGNLAQVKFKDVLQPRTVAGTGVSVYGTMRTIRMVLDGRYAEIYVNGVLGWNAILDSDPDFSTYNTIQLFGQYSVITNKYDNIRLDYAAVPTFGATHYYVSNNGSDSNAGTSSASPWATLNKVNNFTFSPGDIIHFERGGIWRGYLVPDGGTSGSPVTYTSYGDNSSKPLILGSVEMNNTSYWSNAGGNIWSGSLPIPSVTGNELLPNPSFSTNSNGWYLYYTNGASVSKGRTTSVYDSSPASLKVTCSNSGTNGSDIQLWTAPVSIKMGSYYKLTFRAKCTSSFNLGVLLVKNVSPYNNYYSANSNVSQTIGTSWATYTVYYAANSTATDARLDFYMGGSMPAGSTLYIDTLSFKELAGPVLISDIGNIIFNNGAAVGTKAWSLNELDQQNEFWYDSSSMSVKMYSAVNPASLYSDIELAQHDHWGIVTIYNSYVTFDDLALAYGGAHGFVMGGCNNIIIQNCDISYMGGGDQDGPWGPNTVRYGNGVEIWENAHDIFVENCHIRQIWDAGITNQGENANTQYNIYYRYNTIENCEYGYELWNHSSSSSMYHIYFDHNICRDGGSWGHTQRWDPYGTFIQFYYSYASVPGYIYITNNTFDTSASGSLCCNLPWTDFDNVVIDHNTYYQPVGELLIRYPGYFYYANPSDFYWWQVSTGRDTHSVLNPSNPIQDRIPGDANGDNAVDVGDLGILAANYGKTGMTWQQGDFNGDGVVDVGDLGILAANYGEGVSGTVDLEADYAKVFGTTVSDEVTSVGDSPEDLNSSMCSALGLPLVTVLMLGGLMILGVARQE